MRKMKNFKMVFSIALLSAGLLHTSFAQVGVNILSPHPSAAMQIISPPGSFKGLLTPSMTTVNRTSIAQGTTMPADGLMLYDTDHKMPYFYNAGTNRWVSMSPFIFSTSSVASPSVPSGTITTPASGTFSVGINKQTPAQALDVVGNATISGNVNSGGNTSIGGSLSVTGFPVNALVPAGTIVMFHGNTIPNGWTICNGSNGTPDLRGRFIVAAGQAVTTPVSGDVNPNYPVNTIGGENLHTLSKGELPRHFHESNADGSTIYVNGGNHNHYVTPNGQGTGQQRAGGNAGGLASDSQGTIGTTSNTHQHTTNEFSGKVGNGATDGLNNQSHENRPQYYALYFIMKL